MPCSATPAGPWRDAVLRQDFAFRNLNGVGSRDLHNFEAQSHGLQAPCVRLAAQVALTPPNTRFRLPARLAGRDCLPAGSLKEVSDP